MAIKGTLATFSVVKLKDSTVDERRTVRNFLKQKTNDISCPSLELLQEIFKDCMTTDEELLLSEKAEDVLGPTLEGINWLMDDVKANPANYEAINIHRLKSTIEEIPPALEKNLAEMKHVISVQYAVPVAVKWLIDSAKTAVSGEELKKIFNEGFQLLCTLANDVQGELNPDLRINEAHQTHVDDMSQRFKKGYVYHWSIQDELKKVPFEEVFERLNQEQKDQFGKLSALLEALTTSVEMNYDFNWKQVALIRRVYSVMHECLGRYAE